MPEPLTYVACGRVALVPFPGPVARSRRSQSAAGPKRPAEQAAEQARLAAEAHAAAEAEAAAEAPAQAGAAHITRQRRGHAPRRLQRVQRGPGAQRRAGHAAAAAVRARIRAPPPSVHARRGVVHVHPLPLSPPFPPAPVPAPSLPPYPPNYPPNHLPTFPPTHICLSVTFICISLREACKRRIEANEGQFGPKIVGGEDFMCVYQVSCYYFDITT